MLSEVLRCKKRLEFKDGKKYKYNHKYRGYCFNKRRTVIKSCLNKFVDRVTFSAACHRDELSAKENDWNQRRLHLLTLGVTGLPGLRGLPRSVCAPQLGDWLMSCCVELLGPWREASGTARVFRNPSFSPRRVNGAVASVWTSPEEGSPPFGLKLDRAQRRGRRRRSYVFLRIDSASQIHSGFKGE